MVSTKDNFPPLKSQECYDKLLATCSGVERKGKTTPYTSLNGHMFSFLTKEGTMGLRLSSKDREEFIEKFNGKLMVQHERVMKEFVEIPSALLTETDLLSAYLYKSLVHTSSLKPKPSKKK